MPSRLRRLGRVSPPFTRPLEPLAPGDRDTRLTLDACEKEEPEAEHVPAAEVDVAASAVPDPGEELLDAWLVGVRGGVALAVQAPAPLVAIEVVPARGDGVARLEAVLGGRLEQAAVVRQLVAGRLERRQAGLARLAASVQLAEQDESARVKVPGEPSQRRAVAVERGAERRSEVERRLGRERGQVALDEGRACGRPLLREEVRRAVDTVLAVCPGAAKVREPLRDPACARVCASARSANSLSVGRLP
jgi:hypothetical protein